VVEINPFILPSNTIVKAEKDYWTKSKKKRSKRIARAKAREAKDKELVDANRKITELEEKSST